MQRVRLLENCSTSVIHNAPLQVTQEYLNEHNIDLVVHGDQTPPAERQAMYTAPIANGMYMEVPRTPGISTTELINRVASRLAVSFEEHALPSDRDPVAATKEPLV